MGAPLSSGTKLGRYEIRSKIGAGGMGEVYLAHDMQLDRTVAVKILPENVAADRSRLQRFVQEAKAASALNHPNILTVYEIGQTNSTHFIATEYIEGETLREHLSSARMSLHEVLDIFIQVTSALATAHTVGIIHRDMKPENIMIRRDGIVKVLDFGLAKLTAHESADVNAEALTKAIIKTDPGTVVGTAVYMSPEQARGIPLDARTDIFSVGVVLYEVVAGCVPFAGSTSSEVLASILSEKEPQPLARYSREVPAELERVVSKALRKNREERYQTIKDLLLDLKSLKQELEFAAKLKRSAPPDLGDRATTTHQVEQAAVVTNRVSAAQSTSSLEYIVHGIQQHRRSFGISVAAVLLAATAFGYWFFVHRSSNRAQIQSIAVMPFVNETGNSEVEYLSDGMTESLINSLSQLPHLSVKARGSVFRYKGKEVEPQIVASELAVQALVNGRVVQRGDDLTLYLSLVDTRNGNQLWGEQYNRKLTDLVSLQSEIARDVSQKLRARLSGADERNVAKNYTVNVEANQLYLKGRYYLARAGPGDTQKGISYLQEAIAIDPNYALAYVGLANAYRAFALFGERPSNEVFPKSKAAAQKAVELDDRLAEAHAVLGFTIYWYDWDWLSAETQIKRALELNPNSADAHWVYAALHSNLGRHAEALAEIKRARELDPLNLAINSSEGTIPINAGRPDEALNAFQRTFELDPNFFPAHLLASSAYMDKGMYGEALAEVTKARTLNPGSSMPIAFGGYALAKSGKKAEARAALEELLKLSRERYVPPYHVAFLYNGLGERDETFAWLERGLEQRDPKMVFLKVERRWNNLRDDPRFQDLLRRVGFKP
jgi:serine/threonine protein kinase/Tfp pilus assembly protein PilF